jgi:hypothetical protein
MAYEELLSFISSSAFMWIIIILIIWEGVWKGIALWKSGRNNQLAWFVCVLIFNTIGILPIIYLAFFQKKAPEKALKKR